MSAIKTTSFQGGAGIASKDKDGVKLADVLRDVADDITALASTPAWLTAQVVTTHVWTATGPGHVAAVEATAGGTTGIVSIQQSGSPAITTCTLTFTAGVPTLTFNATDAVTAASILFIPTRLLASQLTTKG